VAVKSIGRFAFGVFLLALALRSIYLLQIADLPQFSMTLGDSRAYDEWARSIAGGAWLGERIFYQAPLYPYFLAVVFKIAGHDLVVVRVVQAVLGSAACALLTLAGARFFSPRVGLLAGALLALNPMALFFDGLLQKASLGLFLLTLTLFFLSLARSDTAPRWWAASGAALGFLILARENSLVLLPLLLAWPLLGLRAETRRASVTACLALLAGTAIVLLPVATRNAVVGGELHLTTSQLGPNLYIGNNPNADGTYAPLRFGRGSAEFERTDAFELAAEALGHEPTPSEVSRYWVGEVLDFARGQPVAWLALTGRKLLLTLNATEHGDTEDVYSYSDGSWILRVLLAVLNAGVLLPVAVLGVATTWKERRKHGVLLAMLATYGLSVVAFFVLDRYRFPVIPFLCLYAAAAAWEIADRARAGELRRLAAPVAVALVAAVVCNWPLGSRASIRAATLYNVGVELAQEPERFDEAIEHYERAIRLSPRFAEAHYNLGNAYRRQGRHEDAARRYRDALDLRPDFAPALRGLGQSLDSLGRPEEAIGWYRKAADADPELWEARNDLALALAGRGDFDEAGALLVDLVRARPGDAMLHYNLANVRLQSGRAIKAIDGYRLALGLDPDNPRIHNNLGYALATVGRLDEAAESYREALRLDPDYRAARVNLDALLASGPQ
jgi:tetratricopeptide (TPR) repeat protein